MDVVVGDFVAVELEVEDIDIGDVATKILKHIYEKYINTIYGIYFHLFLCRSSLTERKIRVIRI